MKQTLMRLALLAWFPLTAQAAVESGTSYWIEYLHKSGISTTTTGPVAQSQLAYSKNGPSIPLIDASAGSAADGLNGRLAGGAAVFAVRRELDPGASAAFGSSAMIRDTLLWNGQAPLHFSLDGDWSDFTRIVNELDYGMPGFVNSASVSFSFGFYVSYKDGSNVEHMLARRTLTQVAHRHSDATAEVFAIEHDNGTDRTAAIVGSSHLLETDIGALGFDPGEIDVQFHLSVSAQCGFMAGGIVNNDATCRTSVQMWNTAYAGISGTYTSTSGYSYLGRTAQPPGSVPEPPALALAALALVLLQQRRRPRPGS